MINPDVICEAGYPYEFWCVDGGLINNEPVEYARVALAGGRNIHNARDPRRSDRAVLMIDPLPEDQGCTDAGCGSEPDMVDALFSMFAILRRQARFKPQEVMLAMHEDVHSRFLIAPLRPEKKAGQTELACEGLAGFAGFFNEQLRMHDFQLGRRNCQKFLRDHFVVHVENPIVAPWINEARAAGHDLSPHHPRQQVAGEPVNLDRDFVQLIPLVGEARDPISLRPWPKLDLDEVAPVLAMIDHRAEAIMPKVVRSLLCRIGVSDRRLAGRLIGIVAGRMIRDRLLATTGRAITEDLAARDLLA